MLMKEKIDYTPYFLATDTKLREAYDLLKQNKYVEAIHVIDQMTVDLRMMRTAVISHVE
jgi:hypothetical protein